MKRFLSLFCAVLLFSTLISPLCTAYGETGFPSVSAQAAVLTEKNTGRILYEKNGREHLFPASITKIMTMLLIIEDIEAGKLSLDDTVTASRRASTFGGSCVFLAEGEKMSVSEMLKCIAVVSANDCAIAMAEHIAGNEENFVKRMNGRAAELGLKDTHFTNCTGLFDDGRHYTCALDVAALSRELIKHDTIKQYTTIWMDTIRNGEFGLSNTNKLVYYYPDCTGLKTGYTSTAGYCLSATAERDGVEYIAVVMRAKTSDARNADASAMLDYAFASYELCSLRSDEPLKPVRVEMGKSKFLTAVYDGAENTLIEKNMGEISYDVIMEECVNAPVNKGDRLGTVTVSCGGKTLANIPLVAACDVERMGFWDIFKIIAGGTVGLNADYRQNTVLK